MIKQATEEFWMAYLETAMATETDNRDDSGGLPLDRSFDADDIPDHDLATMRRECDQFWRAAHSLIDDREAEAGRDFFLTRNGHGCGFWDGGWPEVGDRLTEIAQAFAPCHLIAGDPNAETRSLYLWTEYAGSRQQQRNALYLVDQLAQAERKLTAIAEGKSFPAGDYWTFVYQTRDLLRECAGSFGDDPTAG